MSDPVDMGTTFELPDEEIKQMAKNGPPQPGLKKSLTTQFRRHSVSNQSSTGFRDRVSNDTQAFISQEKEWLMEQTYAETSDVCEEQTLKKIKEQHVDMRVWAEKKELLVKFSNQLHFSNDIILQKKAITAEKKLFKLREKMFMADDTIATGFYYDKLKSLQDSPLYECLNLMPKPAVHHIHLTAACNIDFLVQKLCYYDFVYFNQKQQMFKVSKKGCDLPGFVRVNNLRKYWENSTKFDKYLYDSILLQEGVKSQEHHNIWKYF